MSIDVAGHLNTDDPTPKCICYGRQVSVQRYRTIFRPSNMRRRMICGMLIKHRETGFTRGASLGSFILRRSCILTVWLKDMMFRRRTLKVSLLYILGEYNLPVLIKVHETFGTISIGKKSGMGPLNLFGIRLWESRSSYGYARSAFANSPESLYASS